MNVHRHRELCRRLREICPKGSIPPATDEQIRVTEEAIGFPLPALLKMIYTEVANGGLIGSGIGGITGAYGGYSVGIDGRYDTNDQIAKKDPSVRYIDLSTCLKDDNLSQPIYLPMYVRPTNFLHLCYWGCGMDSYLDANNNHVYLIASADPDDAGNCMVEYTLQEAAFEDWVEGWLQDTLPAHWFPGLNRAQDVDEMTDEQPF